MRGVAEEKIPGGKLLRVKVDFCGAVDKVQISGDFFLHPEDAISSIENSLSRISAESDEAEIAGLIEKAAAGSEMIGVSPQDIARVLKKAIENAK